MAEIVLKDRSVRVKIVYYGPALCGKTTNLQHLHARAAVSRRGELLSVNTFQDRTVLFDMLPLRATGPRGFEIRLQLVAVPGQAPYALSRRVALRGADGIVFVANSARDRREENRQSLRELEQHLAAQDMDLNSVPLVMQFNKRDLPDVASPAEMDTDLNPRQAPVWTAVANRGEGVLETLRSVLMATMRDVWRRYPLFGASAEMPAETWVRDALAGVFAGEPAALVGVQPAPAQGASTPAPAEPGTRMLQVGRNGRDGEDGTQQGLGVAEAYADACSQLARAYSEAVTGRGVAEGRLADLQRAALVAEEVLPSDLEGWLRRMLSCLAETAEAAQVSFVRPGAERAQVVTLPPLARDPLLSQPEGRRLVEAALGSDQAQLWEGAERHDVLALLQAPARPFSAVALVPLRCGGRPLGQVLLYFVEGDRLPNHEALAHLRALARILAPPLQLALLSAPLRERPALRSLGVGPRALAV